MSLKNESSSMVRISTIQEKFTHGWAAYGLILQAA